MRDLDLSKFEAIIFDMDGTMIDNMMVHHRAWQQKLKELGMDLPIEEVMQKVHGVNEEIFEKLFGETLTASERKFHAEDKERRYRELIKDSLRLVDGLDEFLKEIKSREMRLAIGSAAPPENVYFGLDNLGIRSLFETILHSEDVKVGKPDPEVYLSIMKRMGVSPEQCLIFEDSPVGTEAAVRSGAEVIVITTTHKKEEFDHLPVKSFISDFNF